MEADGYRAMKKLLAHKPRVDAVFASNDPPRDWCDESHLGRRRRVPEDVALVGAGDIALGDLLRVPLTTVSWSRHELGRRAADLMLDRNDSGARNGFRRVVVEPQLVARASTAV